jgi:hypothetical protein
MVLVERILPVTRCGMSAETSGMIYPSGTRAGACRTGSGRLKRRCVGRQHKLNSFLVPAPFPYLGMTQVQRVKTAATSTHASSRGLEPTAAPTVPAHPLTANYISVLLTLMLSRSIAMLFFTSNTTGY